MSRTIYKRLIWFSLIWFFYACPIFGQAKKAKPLLPEDYHLWSTIADLKISDEGRWCCYNLNYESGMDTLFVKAVGTARKFRFPKGTDGVFNGENWFACVSENRFELLNLITGQKQTTENVESFAFAGVGKYVLVLQNGGTEKKALLIRNLQEGSNRTIENIKSFSIDTAEKFVAAIVEHDSINELIVINLSKGASKLIARSSTERYLTLVWQHNGKSLAFASIKIGFKDASKMNYYSLMDEKLYTFDSNVTKGWDAGRVLKCSTKSSITISDDGKRVFFSTLKHFDEKPIPKDSVEVWNASDKDLFPYRQRFFYLKNQVAVWWPETNKFTIIGKFGEISGKINGIQKFALTYDSAPYKPSFKLNADRDIYLHDLETGNVKLLLKKQFGEYDRMYMSPNGRFICYFKEENWWIYDILKESHRNLTENVSSDLSGPYMQQPGVPEPFGLAAWSTDGQSIVVYDAFDLWKIQLDRGDAQRITMGKEHDMSYRISKIMFEDQSDKSSMFQKIPEVNFDSDIILEGAKVDGTVNGLYTLSSKGKVKAIIAEAKLLSGLCKSKKGNRIAFVKEDFDLAQQIFVTEIQKPKAMQVFQSNPQHQEYNWGKSELLVFRNERGEKRSAVLFYPFDYDPTKKYPMIVRVYQDLSHTLHKYVNPNLINTDGYNITNFVANGYFVLHPNIVYQHGSRGLSATKCIVDATQAALAMASIDERKIGLMGHSFGGYETYFAITQTPIFAAAVAGAGVSDLTVNYLSMGWNFSKAETWRFEHEQGGMGKAMYDAPGSYRDNSAITFADRVSTPLLSWTGANDPQVDPIQTMEFYMAMRRLGNVNVMLRYPDEGHSLLKPENEIDLTIKIMQWFNFYLKGEQRPKWSIPK